MVPFEIFIVATILVIFLLVSSMSYAWAGILLLSGTAFIVTGLVFGIPAGIIYHVLLFKKKGQIGRRLGRWWVSPHMYHEFLIKEDQQRLNAWFRIGAVFFSISIIGCGLVFLAILIGLNNSP